MNRLYDDVVDRVKTQSLVTKTFTRDVRCMTCEHEWTACWHGFPNKTCVESLSRLTCIECWSTEITLAS
jgi:hypothetical protein